MELENLEAPWDSDPCPPMGRCSSLAPEKDSWAQPYTVNSTDFPASLGWNRSDPIMVTDGEARERRKSKGPKG